MIDTKQPSTFHLSPMQQGMLLHSLDEKGSYVQQIVCSLGENVDTERFVRAWQLVFERHTVLKIGFEWEALDEPLQRVNADLECPIVFDDWSGIDPEGVEDRFETYLRDDRLTGFDVAKPPLMRVAVFRLSENEYRVVWTFHHGLLDGRSHFLVLKEVFDVYDGFCSAQELESIPPRPFSDYIDWLDGQNLAAAEEYWKEVLRGFSEPTFVSATVPPMLDRPGFLDFPHASEQITLSEELAVKLKDLAAGCEATLNNVFQGAWALLLSRYTGNVDVSFGAARAGRHWADEDTNSMVGLFINTLPMRVNVQPEQPLSAWLKELRLQHVNHRDFEHTSLGKVQEWSEIQRGLPLFDSVLVFETYRIREKFHSLGGKWLNRDIEVRAQSNYPLVLMVYAGTEIILGLEYDKRLFDRSVIERMLVHIKTLVESMTTGSSQQIGDLSLISAEERNLIIGDWRMCNAEYPRDKCIHELFEEQVLKTPDATAVSNCGDRLSYADLNYKANRIANHLRTLGVGQGDLVGISVERSFSLVAAVLAVLKAGAGYVPLDPSYPTERLKHILTDAQLSVVLTQERFTERFVEHAAKVICLDLDRELIDLSDGGNPNVSLATKSPAYVIYTSGSTGRPNGVIVPHRSLVNHAIAIIKRYGLNSDDRVLQFSSFNFDVAGEELFPSLLCGASVVLMPSEEQSSLERFSEFLLRNSVSVVNVPTSYWHQWTMSLESGKSSLSGSIRLVVTGSERVLAEDYNRWRIIAGTNVRWLNAYGLTETTITSLVFEPSRRDVNLERIPIGKPLDNTEIYLLDRSMQPVPIGIPGELYIGGDCLALGYLNMPAITGKKFVPHPFHPTLDSRLYKTGDMARYLPSGDIEFLGRSDNQVKIRGFRVELGEIQNVLSQLEDIRDAVVVAREKDAGDKHLVAYVVSQTGSKLEPAGLRRYLRQKLPEYMIPSVYVQLDSLPLTPNGKINRKALPAPAGDVSAGREGYQAPRTETEKKLAEIWSELLGVDRIGVDDNFFDLGGHSLSAIRMFSKVEETFEKTIPLATLFEAGTIAKLAEILNQDNWSESKSSIVPIQPNGTRRPLFCIHARGGDVLFYRDLAKHLGDEQPLYGIQARRDGGRAVDQASVEAMAQDYIEEIKSVQSEGPYFLVGMCFGAYVALEIAQQLSSQGQNVARLIVLDSGLPRTTHASPKSQSKSLGYYARTSLARLLSAEFYRTFLKWCAERKLARRTSDWFRWRIARKTAEPGTRRNRSLERAYGIAAAKYVARSYGGHVTLIRSEEFARMQRKNGHLLWGELARGGFEHFVVPGRHLELLREPTVEIVARRLTASLNSAIANRVGLVNGNLPATSALDLPKEAALNSWNGHRPDNSYRGEAGTQ